MANFDVFKEYLVKLGFHVDEMSYRKATQATSEFEKILEKYMSASSMSAVKSTSAIAAGFVLVAGTVAKTVSAVAQADLSYQLIAQRLWLSTEAAKSFTIALETMGHSLHEIAWNKELREHYFDIIEHTRRLETPSEAKEMFRQVRGITHEFNKLRITGKYALEDLSYQFLKANYGFVTSFREWLSSLGERVAKTIEEWNLVPFFKELGNVFVVFGRVVNDVFVPAFEAIWGVIKKVGEGIAWLWDLMEPWQKQVVLLAGLIVLVFSPVAGPILTVVSALTTLYLLLDDFYAYMEGRDSAEVLKPLWKIVTFLREVLEVTILSIIVAADHMWYALQFKRHPSGKGFLEHLSEELAELERTWKIREDKRNRTREQRERQAAVESFGGGKELLDTIAVAEGTSEKQAKQHGYKSGYDISLGYGLYGKEPKPISKMTLAELKQHQSIMLAEQRLLGKEDPSSAVGRYQFTTTTLFGEGKDKGLVGRLGLSMDTVFSPELQDQLALIMLGEDIKRFEKAKGRTITAKDFQYLLAGRWSSIPSPYTGASRHKQRTGISQQEIQDIIGRLQSDSAPGISYSPSSTVSSSESSETTTNNINVSIHTDTKDPVMHGQIAGDEIGKRLAEMKAQNAINSRVIRGT